MKHLLYTLLFLSFTWSANAQNIANFRAYNAATITNKTGPNSITPHNVGGNIDSLCNYLSIWNLQQILNAGYSATQSATNTGKIYLFDSATSLTSSIDAGFTVDDGGYNTGALRSDKVIINKNTVSSNRQATFYGDKLRFFADSTGSNVRYDIIPSSTFTIPSVTATQEYIIPFKNNFSDTFAMLSDIVSGTGTVSSVGLSMPSAFSVANSPITSAGTLSVTTTGTSTDYIKGDGTIAPFPTTAGGSGGATFYFNGNTLERNISGIPYYQISTIASFSTTANFTKTGDGLLASFITDSLKPNQTSIPAGVWIFSTYFSMSSNSGSPQIFAVINKWNGSTLTVLDTSQIETLTGGTVKDLYTFSASMPTYTLSATDRIAVQFYTTNNGGKTTTLYTEDNNYASVSTTFPRGINSLNGLTANAQTFATGTTGSDFGISSSGTVHTFNLPTASSSNRGALSTTDWSAFNSKVSSIIAGTYITTSGTTTTTVNADTTRLSTKAYRQKAVDSLNTLIAAKVGSVVLNTPNILFATPINFTTSAGIATGSLTLNTQSPNTFLAGATSGTVTPTFRAIVSGDIPSSVALAGSPTTTTQSAGDNSTKIATTAYVDSNYQLNPSVASYTGTITCTTIASNRTSSTVYYEATAQSGNLYFAAPTGTWANHQILRVDIKDNGTPSNLTYNSIFISGSTVNGGALPTITTASKKMKLEFEYDVSLTKFTLIGYANGY